MPELNKDVKPDENVEVTTDEKMKNNVDKVNKPENININIELPKIEKEKEYKGEEVEELVKKAMAKASVTTKQQLQDNIAKLTNKIQELESKIPQEEVQKKTEQLTEEKSKLEETLTELKNKLEVLEDGFVKEREKTLELQERIKKERLSNYRDMLIKEANGAIIADMVTGNTEEELKASAEKAKVKYQEIWEEQRKKLGLPEQPKQEEKVEKAEINIQRIPGDMHSISEWKNKRAAIKEQILRELKLK